MSRDNRPGCFGSPLCFNAEGAACYTCPDMGACVPAVEARVQRLKSQFGITAMRLEAKRKPAKTTGKTVKVLA